MSSVSLLARHFGFTAAAAAIMISTVPAEAHQALQRFSQAEQRGPNGRIAVEASVITVIGCNSPGERGGQYYIYQYLNRPGFRAIMPPNWSQPIGGRDWATFQEAAYAACVGAAAGPVQPVQPAQQAAGAFAGRWWGFGSNDYLYDVNQIGSTFTWVRLNTNEVGQGSVNGDRIDASWGGSGPGSATGTITARNAAGVATRVDWSNGVFWTR